MKRISTGIENFKELLDNNYYYVDKTKLIEDVLSDKVMLYTRPRRFGKTLNMSMLYYFFSNKEKENAYLFDGLYISKQQEAKSYQNQYPVIFLSLKDMQSLNMEEQEKRFAGIISKIVIDNIGLLDSEEVDNSYKERLNDLRFLKANKVTLEGSLYLLAQAMKQFYKANTIILIDEYDVPLQSAYLNGYYYEMSYFMSNIFSLALKTNDSLERGIFIGCLRISKESIFTGLNNFRIYSIFSKDVSSTHFGFTQEEIDDLLNYYRLDKYRDKMKEWYDGYLFGDREIYNP